MCYGEGRGIGRWVARCSFEKLGVARWSLSVSVTALGLGGCAQTSHTPAPLERGELRCCFLFVNEGEWLVSPLERGLRGVLR